MTDEPRDEPTPTPDPSPRPVMAGPSGLILPLPPPARHIALVPLGGEEVRLPSFAYQAVTIVNRTAQVVYVSPQSGEATALREDATGDAIEVPAGFVVTEPLSGGDLYLAAAGSSGNGRVVVYRWARPMPAASYPAASAGGGGAGGLVYGFDGTDEVALSVTAGGHLNVSDGGNALSVDDGGGSLTIDGSVSLSGAVPAGANTIGNVGITSSIATDPQLDYLLVGGTAVTVVRANVDLSADGSLIAAPSSGLRNYVAGLALQADAATITKCVIRDGTAGTALWTLYPGANGGMVLPLSAIAWIKQPSTATLLSLDITGTGNVGGGIVYAQAA